ncbi:MAG: hypothetical protein H0V14_05370, partial [Chitinophagaceae bacterium]|nr:hypothetical protein [Chitinophagaceae bacterium]
MGKDKTGKFHPGKGKPSGINKKEGLGIHSTSSENMKQYDEITEKYIEGEDELSPNVSLRHPNRNTSKGEDTYKAKENNAASDKAVNDTLAQDRTPTVPEELPGILTKELFKELATFESACCISIFLGNAGVEVNENYDPISFKNALQKATSILKEKNKDATAIERMLEPGYELLRNDEFWLQLSPGLAIFIADGYFKYIKMQQATTVDIVVEDTFYVTPLIPIMVSNEYFYLLVISKKQSKLFKGDAFGMEYIPLERVPNGLAEELGDTDVETTFRTGGRGGTGGANFHGIGGGNNNDDKAYLTNYLESVDDVIWKQILHNENVPLLLAGVEYLIPIYRSVSDYKNLWEEALTGSHEHNDTPALYKLAREKMEPYFQQRVNKALENYGNQSATELTSSKIDEVIPATYYGRVSHLFVQKGEHIWGTFDDMASELNFIDENTQGAQDLIDNAVVKTLLNGGEVFLLD